MSLFGLPTVQLRKPISSSRLANNYTAVFTAHVLKLEDIQTRLRSGSLPRSLAKITKVPCYKLFFFLSWASSERSNSSESYLKISHKYVDFRSLLAEWDFSPSKHEASHNFLRKSSERKGLLQENIFDVSIYRLLHNVLSFSSSNIHHICYGRKGWWLKFI